MTKDICIIGLGYIGLPTAALLANRGFKVFGVDVTEDVVNTVNNGDIHIVEPELDAYVAKAVKEKNLVAGIEPKPADVFIIAVPTPFHDGHVPNIDYVEAATRAIAPVVKSGNMVVLESTSPVGTTERVADVLKEEGVDTSLCLSPIAQSAYCLVISCVNLPRMIVLSAVSLLKLARKWQIFIAHSSPAMCW